MVTEEERQFMWNFYAPEPRMRLNLGIRRRLVPLLGSDRARIELANSLLFTLPGSPVIYYGDEIGMGEDIWLEDRGGVRTPMQWHAGPGAGFSSADPAQFYAPVIDNETHGYQQVNVAAQRGDPDSLLSLMRRLIAIRKEHPAFGRGDLRFLEPDNKAVLAFVRSYEGETLLCVHNLSEMPQTVALDVRSCLPAGTAAVELVDLLGGEMIGPWQDGAGELALSRYGYCWLQITTAS